MGRALRDDAIAQRQTLGEVVGIDFDPFVGGQESAAHYDIRNVRFKNNHCMAEIWRTVPRGMASEVETPDATAVLAPVKGAWLFCNFFYPKQRVNLM